MTRGLEDLFHKERLQYLGLFCLEKNERGFMHINQSWVLRGGDRLSGGAQQQGQWP